MEDKMNNLFSHKRSQVTIFIIIGIIVVAVILLFLILRGETGPDINGKPEENPEAFLQECLIDEVYSIIDLILMNGGYINPEFSYFCLFEDELYPQDPQDFSYLCYTERNDIHPCFIQEPVIWEHIEEEIENYLREEGIVEGCFNDLTNSLQKQGYVVEVRKSVSSFFNVTLNLDKIIIRINAELTLTKSGETSKEKDFIINVPTKLGEIIFFPVSIILGKEASSACGFDITDLDYLNDDFNIDKFAAGSGEEIYWIEHRESKEKFEFAVRSCVYPPGWVG